MAAYVIGLAVLIVVATARLSLLAVLAGQPGAGEPATGSSRPSSSGDEGKHDEAITALDAIAEGRQRRLSRPGRLPRRCGEGAPATMPRGPSTSLRRASPPTRRAAALARPRPSARRDAARRQRRARRARPRGSAISPRPAIPGAIRRASFSASPPGRRERSRRRAQWFDEIVADQETPGDLRQRAQLMLALIDVAAKRRPAAPPRRPSPGLATGRAGRPGRDRMPACHASGRHRRPAQRRQVDAVQPAGRPEAGAGRRQPGRHPRPPRGRGAARRLAFHRHRHRRARGGGARESSPAACARRPRRRSRSADARSVPDRRARRRDAARPPFRRAAAQLGQAGRSWSPTRPRGARGEPARSRPIDSGSASRCRSRPSTARAWPTSAMRSLAVASARAGEKTSRGDAEARSRSGSRSSAGRTPASRR